jgi:hypothetical protein
MNATNILPRPLPSIPSPAKVTKDPLEYISASRLKSFHTCRLQWYFRYIEQLPSKVSPSLLVGKVVHAVLQAWNLARWRGEDSSVERMDLVFEACWIHGCEEEGMIWNSPERGGQGKGRCPEYPQALPHPHAYPAGGETRGRRGARRA